MTNYLARTKFFGEDELFWRGRIFWPGRIFWVRTNFFGEDKFFGQDELFWRGRIFWPGQTDKFVLANKRLHDSPATFPMINSRIPALHRPRFGGWGNNLICILPPSLPRPAGRKSRSTTFSRRFATVGDQYLR